jgi:hypothetical protein
MEKAITVGSEAAVHGPGSRNEMALDGVPGYVSTLSRQRRLASEAEESRLPWSPELWR